ncbi:MAG: hypothetical protein JWN15_3142, partial [Firmicutes bacterium]|nr:hypothetical protein [Bacillota bacterium]
ELVSCTGPDWTIGSGDARFETVGTFRRRTAPAGAPDAVFAATVVDVPRVTEAVTIAAPAYEWQVANNLYDSPGGTDEHGVAFAASFPDPIVEIVAGDHPVAVPILVQRDLRRLVLINRFIPPGATLRVDLVAHTLTDIAGPVTLEGPVRYNETTPPLLYGTGGLVHDTGAGDLSGPATRPFHLVRWHKTRRREEGMPEVPGPPGSMAHVPIANLPWPALLPLGSSRWSLLVGVGRDNEAPELDAQLPHTLVRALPATVGLGPQAIRFGWSGRRLATFTLRFDQAHLCDGPSPAGLMQHRAAWLREQVERLKLAGVIYLAQDALAPGPPPISEPEDPSLILWQLTRPDQTHGLSTQPVPRSTGVTESLILRDAVAMDVTAAAAPSISATETLVAGDTVALVTTAPAAPSTAATETLMLQDTVALDVTTPEGGLAMPEESVLVHGHVILEVTTASGMPGDSVEGTNTVVDGGRRLLANLLAGTAGSPAFEAVVGIGTGDTKPDMTTLYDTDGLSGVRGELESADGKITLRGVFPAGEKERSLNEAGLVLTCRVGDKEETTLYNRAQVKPPLTVRVGEVLTVTWTLTFAPQQ